MKGWWGAGVHDGVKDAADTRKHEQLEDVCYDSLLRTTVDSA
jgi:hypothetical protein